MFNVCDRESARNAYRVINMFGTMKDDAVMDMVDQLKRGVRKWTHRETAQDVGMGFMVERHIVKEYGIDGYVELVSIPDVFDTIETADEFFKDFLYLRCRPSMYDCTGQAFTSWYKLFKRHGQFYAYHSISFDV